MVWPWRCQANLNEDAIDGDSKTASLLVLSMWKCWQRRCGYTGDVHGDWDLMISWGYSVLDTSWWYGCVWLFREELQDLFARTSKERTIRAFKRGPLTRYRQDLRRRTFERIWSASDSTYKVINEGEGCASDIRVGTGPQREWNFRRPEQHYCI